MKNKSQKFEYYEIVWGGPVRADPNGLILVKENIKNFNEQRFYKGMKIEDWPEDITFFMKGQLNEDYLVVGLHWMVVSERVRMIFEECQVKGVQFLPVHIIIEPEIKEIGPYWVMNVFQEIEALDWEHTTWLHPDKIKQDPLPMMDAFKVALLKKPLEGIDIFRLKVKGKGDTDVFISAGIKKYLDKAGANVGFKFNGVPSY